MKHQNLLFSTEYGSKLYGTNTPTSDTDLKHIVLPDLNTLLLGKKVENKVKKTNTEKNTRNSVDDVDEEFIPLQIFARHFVEGQTYAIELAFAVDGGHAGQRVYDHRGMVTSYKKAQPNEYEHLVEVYDRNFECWDWEKVLFIEFVHELRTKFLASNIKAMMGHVVNQASLYSFKGERLNATRELLDMFNFYLLHFGISDASSKTTEEFDVAFDGEVEALAAKYPKYFRKDEYDVGGGVMRPCFVILEKTLPFTNSIAQSLKVLHALKDKYGSRADQASESNVDWKATMHALRIVDEGIELLREHKLTLPFEKFYVDRLLAIKRGEVSLDLIKEELSSKLDRLKDLEKMTTLPTCNAEFLLEFDVWLVKWLKRFYF